MRQPILGSELNYGISDIECLAVVFLIRKWHHYLYGVCTLYTDHKALTSLMSITNYHGRLGRQAMLLQEYQFTMRLQALSLDQQLNITKLITT